RRPSASMVVAFVALFIALTGGAYAVRQVAVSSPPNPRWGIITRNTIGSPVADLRTGPYGSFGHTGAFSTPPRGQGSLGIEVSDNSTTQSPPSEKVSFGNEVDFLRDLLSHLNRVGFSVFQTANNDDIGPLKLPNVPI